MINCKKKSDLYREYARVIDMCNENESTLHAKLHANECVKYYGHYISAHPLFNDKPENYDFAIAIVEGMPVFVGDVLWDRCFRFRVSGIKNGILFGSNIDGLIHIEISPESCSWSPPKPKTFMLNGVEFELPVGGAYSTFICGLEYKFSSKENMLKLSKALMNLLCGMQ